MDLVTFIEKTFNGKLHFLCSVLCLSFIDVCHQVVVMILNSKVISQKPLNIEVSLEKFSRFYLLIRLWPNFKKYPLTCLINLGIKKIHN